VAWIVLNPRARGRAAGFAEIPLEMRNPVGLAALACIITSTPGTAWAGYDSRSGVLTMHILDLVDQQTWVQTVKSRYERRLIAIFGVQ
jgi:multicomponent K+:H+ antiporter subunit E